MSESNKRLAVLIAYGRKDNEKNVINFINKLLWKPSNLNIDIFVGWNELGNVGKKWNPQSLKVTSPSELPFSDNEKIKIFKIKEKDGLNTKAYYTWNGILKRINVNDFDYFLFVKDVFDEDLDLNRLIEKQEAASIYDYHTELDAKFQTGNISSKFKRFAYEYKGEGKRLKVPVTRFIFLKRKFLQKIYDQLFGVPFWGSLCKKQFLILEVLKNSKIPVHFYKRDKTFNFNA